MPGCVQIAVWLLVLVVCGLPAAAQQTAPAELAPADGRTEYMGRQIAVTMHFAGAPWLVRESREREEDCATLLERLRIKPGMQVVDMGCGNGFYTLRLAELVGKRGQVWAVDIQPEMLRLLQARAADRGLQNIQLTLGQADDPKLPAGCADLILCVDVYHEFSFPKKMLVAMRQALKPDGQLVLAEFRGEDPAVPIKPLHKMTKAQVLKELGANGFRLVREFDGLPWQHLMFFQRS